MRKTPTRGLIVGAVMALGIGFASPAFAAIPVVTPNPADGTVNITGVERGGPLNAADFVKVCTANISQSDCENAGGFTGDHLYNIVADGNYGVGSTVFGRPAPSVSPTNVPLPAGVYTMLPIQDDNNGQVVGTIISVVIGIGSSSGAAASQPQTLTLSINTTDDSSCKQSSVSGLAGTWIDLPGADDCTAPTSKPEADLLGWATTPNIPATIAQRQIDNGWGAYEKFSDEGRLTAVFIPVGGATFLSGDGNLFAVWSE